jgi:hypothetical protein
MEHLAITEYVIRELSRYRKRDDIVLAVCEREGLPWNEAESLVQQVETQYAGRIARRQLPFLLLAGIGVTIAGIALMVGMSILTILGIVIVFLRIPIPYLGNLVFFVIGMLMTTGGIVGMINLMRVRQQPPQA